MKAKHEEATHMKRKPKTLTRCAKMLWFVNN